MKKYKVTLKCVQHYSNAVIVEAADPEQAREKVLETWNRNDGLYEETTDSLDDQTLELSCDGPATEEDIHSFSNVAKFVDE